MTLIVCCSATGAPGTSTSAIGLALTWPRDVLLVDADRDPAQVVEAGYLRGVDPGGRGLAHLARAHRERRPIAEELPRQSILLQEHPTLSRRFLPGFAHPGSANVFQAVWPELAETLHGLESAGTDAVVDAGRIGREGLPAALLGRADHVLVFLRSSLRSLAAARLHLPGLRAHLDMLGAPADLSLVLVGEGRPYTADEIGAQFALPVAGVIAWDPERATVLSDGQPEPRRFAAGSLIRSYRALSSTLSAQAQARQPAPAPPDALVLA